MAKSKDKKPETKAERNSFTYKYTGKNRVSLPEFNLIVNPGDEIELTRQIDNPNYKLLD